MAITRDKAKGRRESGTFIPLPTSVLNHQNFTRLSGNALKLLMDLLSQLRLTKGGTVNNGDLCATWSMMKKRGWKSSATLQNAKNELIHYGFIVLTRQGQRLRKDKPCLYAITWWAINDCKGKLDVKSALTPLGSWKHEVPIYAKQ